MTATPARRSRDRATDADDEDPFRGAAPMTGTGRGPRPDPTGFAPRDDRPADPTTTR